MLEHTYVLIISDFALTTAGFTSFDSKEDLSHSPKRLLSITSLNSNTPVATEPGFFPALPNSWSKTLILRGQPILMTSFILGLSTPSSRAG